jgi:hypothetical protein
VLDFMQPLAAGGQLIGFGWEARRDEPGREGTLQHNAIAKAYFAQLALSGIGNARGYRPPLRLDMPKLLSIVPAQLRRSDRLRNCFGAIAFP